MWADQTELLLQVVLKGNLCRPIILALVVHDVLDFSNELFGLLLIDLHILDNCFSELLPHLLKNDGVEVQVGILAEISTAEARL